MTEKQEKTPEQIATEKLAKAYWDSMSQGMDSNYLAMQVLANSARDSIKAGVDPRTSKTFGQDFVKNVQQAQIKHYGLDKTPDAEHYIATGQGWSEELIADSIIKNGYSGAAIDAMTNSEQRQNAMQIFQNHKFRASKLSPEEIKHAAKESGLIGLLDDNQVARDGGIERFANLVGKTAYENSQGAFNPEQFVKSLEQAGKGYLVNQKAFEKYLKK